MNCNNCNKRDSCVRLCPAMEEYVNKDYVPLREVLASDIRINVEQILTSEIQPLDSLNTTHWIVIENKKKLSPLQKKYLYLKYWLNKSYAEIGRMSSTTRQNVYKIIKRAKNKL